jgi:hypothetical protein
MIAVGGPLFIVARGQLRVTAHSSSPNSGFQISTQKLVLAEGAFLNLIFGISSFGTRDFLLPNRVGVVLTGLGRPECVPTVRGNLGLSPISSRRIAEFAFESTIKGLLRIVSNFRRDLSHAVAGGSQ